MLTFEKAMEKYRAWMVRRNFSGRSIQYKNDFFRPFGKWLFGAHQEAYQDVRAVTCEVIDDYLDFIALKGYKPASMQISISNVRTFFRFLYKNDLISEDPTRKVDNVRVPKKEVIYVPHEEVIKTLDEMFIKFRKGNRYEIAVRDYFIIRCAYVTGWRASESLACNPQEDIDWNTGQVYIPKRKGGGDGYVYLDQETLGRLKQWYFSNYPNGKRLWYTIGSKKGKPMKYQGYKKVFLKYFGVGSHRIRASFATHLHFQGVDVKDIKDLMGHKSITSTMSYVAKDNNKLKQIHREKNPFSKGAT